jgi:hypothetical protein
VEQHPAPPSKFVSPLVGHYYVLHGDDDQCEEEEVDREEHEGRNLHELLAL